MRHCLATHLLEDHYDICTIQELPGHKDVKTSMVYSHLLNREGLVVRSTIDTALHFLCIGCNRFLQGSADGRIGDGQFPLRLASVALLALFHRPIGLELSCAAKQFQMSFALPVASASASCCMKLCFGT